MSYSDRASETTDGNVEMVARAIFAADGSDADWKWQPGAWERRSHEHDRYKHLARAAIEAMRGLTSA